MPQMRLAAGAAHFLPHHAVAEIQHQFNIFSGHRPEK